MCATHTYVFIHCDKLSSSYDFSVDLDGGIFPPGLKSMSSAVLRYHMAISVVV